MKFKVTVTEKPSDITFSSFTEQANEADKVIGVLTFYSVPRVGEKFPHRHADEVVRGYVVENVYHYTKETNPNDGTIGMIQVSLQVESPQ